VGGVVLRTKRQRASASIGAACKAVSFLNAMGNLLKP
jgi:hypothetical protein